MNIRPWLRLCRIGGASTAISGSLAGNLMGPQPLGASILPCLFISLGLYLFGMVSNDLLDIQKDRQLRPDRPLPSGEIPEPSAFLFLCGIIFAMVSLSMALRPAQCLYFSLSGICILLYNGPLKSHFWTSSIFLGCARAFNFLGGWGPEHFNFTAFVILALYIHLILIIMTLAEGEDTSQPIGPISWSLWFAMSLILVTWCQFFAIPWISWTGFHIWKFRNSQRNIRPKLIGIMVASLSLFEATFLATHHSLIVGLLFCGIYVLGRKLSRSFPIG